MTELMRVNDQVCLCKSKSGQQSCWRLRSKSNFHFVRHAVGRSLRRPGGTVGPIAVALAIDGEPIQTSRAIVTPAAAGDYFNVTSTAIIKIPRGCCFNVSVENVSEPAAVGDVAPSINVQNANLVVTRIS